MNLTRITQLCPGAYTPLTQVDSLVFDWELRKGTTDRVQEFMIDVGVITGFDTPVAEDAVVDRGFYLAAVGAE